MKKNILLLVGIFSLGVMQAQVGVNTNSPQGVFHIDGQGDTNGNTNISDDVVISTTGNIGVGTNAPATKLDIRASTKSGGLRLQDGSQGADKVLFSDANGNASWANLSPKTTSGVMSSTDIPLVSAYKYLGMYISVPPGKSQVFAGGMVTNADSFGYVTTSLSMSTTSLTRTGISVYPQLAGFGVHQNRSIGQVTFFVTNTYSVAKTLYLWGILSGGASTGTWQYNGVAEPFIFVAY